MWVEHKNMVIPPSWNPSKISVDIWRWGLQHGCCSWQQGLGSTVCIVSVHASAPVDNLSI